MMTSTLLKQLAQWLVEAGKPEEASKALQNAMYIDPFNQPTHELLGEIAFKNKDLPLALRTYQALLALDPRTKPRLTSMLPVSCWRWAKRARPKKRL